MTGMKSNTPSISRQFRQRAGLPEVKGDSREPTPADAEPVELATVDGPEGGYGGQGEEPDSKSEGDETKDKAEKPAAKKSEAKTAKKTAAKKTAAKPAKKTAAKKGK